MGKWTDWSQMMAAPPWLSLSGSHIPSASWRPRPWCYHPHPGFCLQKKKGPRNIKTWCSGAGRDTYTVVCISTFCEIY